MPAQYRFSSQDTVVRPATTQAMYAAKPAPAAFATITGGHHRGFVDSSAFPGLGCDSEATSRST